MMNLLLLSSSRVGNGGYLEQAARSITQQVDGVDQVVFIPYAGVTMDADTYTDKVRQALPQLSIKGIHEFAQPGEAIAQAQAIMVGGGNTFHLLYQLYRHNLLDAIRTRVAAGVPYIGWSAGSNIAGQSIRTTNDMPIIEPPSFDALQLLPVQINPHYTDYQPPGHNGETRAERLAEFMCLNPDMPIIALPEGTAITCQGSELHLQGDKAGWVFHQHQQHKVEQGAELSGWLSGK